MSSLVFACVAPHGSALLPFVSGLSAQASVKAMEELGGRMADAKPDIIVIMTPHGLRMEERFCLYDAASLRGRLKGEGEDAAFIASADMGHAHDPGHFYGYDPASAEFDHFVAERIAAQDLGAIETIDIGWMQRAKTDAYGQLLVLSGLLREMPLRGETLSYEVPSYYGMLCAAFGNR
jgi:aromatic ring-opening dioxygenase LigB subunit